MAESFMHYAAANGVATQQDCVDIVEALRRAEEERRGQLHRPDGSLWDCEVPMVAAINGHAIGLGLKIGIVPGDGGAWILARASSLSRASEMILTGDTIDARTAESYGLVSRVVPGEQLLSEAQQQRLSDVLELSAAFLDKRDPRFTGE